MPTPISQLVNPATFPKYTCIEAFEEWLGNLKPMATPLGVRAVELGSAAPAPAQG